MYRTKRSPEVLMNTRKDVNRWLEIVVEEITQYREPGKVSLRRWHLSQGLREWNGPVFKEPCLGHRRN